MVREVEGELKKKLMKDGSHLKKIRSLGGGGAALIATGIMLIVICWMIAAAMMPISKSIAPTLILGAAGTIAGLLFVLLGEGSKRKRVSNAYSYFTKKSGYTETQLKEFDQEFQDGPTLFISPSKKLDKVTLRDGAVFTKHWVKLPYMNPIIYSGLYRTDDVAAVWYENEPFYYGVQRHDPSVITINIQGELKMSCLKREAADEFIDEVLERNPNAVRYRTFATQAGHAVDALSNPKAAAKAYQEAILSD